MKKSQRELRKARQRLAQLDRYQFDTDGERQAIERKIASLEAEPCVSDHAIVRYIERVYGIDIEAIKAELLTEDAREQIKIVGSGKIPSGPFTLVVKRGTVVTVLTEEE